MWVLVFAAMCLYLWNEYKEERDHRRYLQRERDRDNPPQPKQRTFLGEWFKALHDKTCPIIEFTSNVPDREEPAY